MLKSYPHLYSQSTALLGAKIRKEVIYMAVRGETSFFQTSRLCLESSLLFSTSSNPTLRSLPCGGTSLAQSTLLTYRLWFILQRAGKFPHG